MAGGREGEADEIVEDEDLAVAAGAGADADGGNRELGGDCLGDFARHALKHDGAGAGLSEGAGIGLQLANGFRSAGLHAVAAHAMHALRGEAEMADDGHFGINEGADEVDARAFNFDRFGAGFLDEADGVGHGRRRSMP